MRMGLGGLGETTYLSAGSDDNFEATPITIRLVPVFGHPNMWWEMTMNHRFGGSIKQEEENMTLLIPDRDKASQEDLIWCCPIERVKWNKWFALSEKFKTCAPKEHGGVRYMNRMEGREVKTIMLMPTGEQSDDDAVTSLAFLRLVKQLSCRAYIVRCTDDPLRGARLIHATAGLDPALLTEVDDDEEGQE